MKDLFFLDAVLTTKVVTFAYWILLLVVWVFGLLVAFNPDVAALIGAADVSVSVLYSLLILFFGTIIVRLWAELWVVIFKIQQNTRRTVVLLDEVANLIAEQNNLSKEKEHNLKENSRLTDIRVDL